MDDEKRRSGVRFTAKPAIPYRLKSPFETHSTLDYRHAAGPPKPHHLDHEPPPAPRPPLWRRVMANLGWTAVGLGAASGAVGFAPPAYSHVQVVDTPKAPAKPVSPITTLPEAVAEHVGGIANREGDGFDDLLREALKHCGEVAIGVCLNIVGTRIARALFGWKPELAENANAERLMAELKALKREVAELKAKSFQTRAFRLPSGIFPLGRWPGSIGIRRTITPGRAVPPEEELRDLEILSSLMDTTEPAELLADARKGPPIPEGDVFARFGQEICLRLAALARGALCGKDGLAAKVGDASVEEIAKAIRTAAFTSTFSQVAAYAIAGTAAVISKSGLEYYCKGHSRHA